MPTPTDITPKRLQDWIVTPAPKAWDKRALAANHSRYEWKVLARRGQVAVERHDPRRPEAPLPFAIRRDPGVHGVQRSVRVKDGWIVGIDAGEWGGSLWHYSPDGQSRRRISGDQVVGFFRPPTA